MRGALCGPLCPALLSQQESCCSPAPAAFGGFPSHVQLTALLGPWSQCNYPGVWLGGIILVITWVGLVASVVN